MVAALPLGKTQYPLYRRLGGSYSLSGRLWKNSPPSGSDPQTVQPVASRYTDYAIPAPTPTCGSMSSNYNTHKKNNFS